MLGRFPETPRTKRVLVTSFLVNVLDVALNGAVALATGSIVMVAELLQGAADLVVSLFLIIGFERSRKPPDRTHPFGYGRELYFWTLMSTLIMLTLTAGFSVYFGWQRFLRPLVLHDLTWAYIILAVSVVSNGYSLTLSMRKLADTRGKQSFLPHFFQSPLIETKVTFVSDLMGTLAAVFGLLALGGYRLSGDLRLDGVGAMGIGVSVGILAYLLLLGVKDLLIGKTASPDTEQKIRELVNKIPGIASVEDLRTIIIGHERLLVNLEIHVDHALKAHEIEVLMDDIRRKLKEKIPSIHHLQIELETPEGELAGESKI